LIELLCERTDELRLSVGTNARLEGFEADSRGVYCHESVGYVINDPRELHKFPGRS